MTKKEKFQCELLIDYALDLNNIDRNEITAHGLETIERIGRIESMIRGIFKRKDGQNE